MSKIENKEYVLVKYCSDWADEMTVEGFAAFEKQFWLDYVEKVKKAHGKKDVHFYFGTNQDIRCSVKDFFKDMKVKNISETEYKFLLKHFQETEYDDFEDGKFKTEHVFPQFGHFPFFANDDLKDRALDEEEDDEEE